MSIDRIAKLLQMAEGAKTPHEAAAFFAKAQAIATAHEISLAEARLRQPKQQRVRPVQQRVVVGRPRQQANRHYLRLLVALARSNGCEIGLYHDNTTAVLFGLPSDIASVERLFGAIAPQMIRFGESYLAQDKWRDELVLDLRTGYPRSVSRQGARASFYQGFVDTLSRRIREAAEQSRKEAAAKQHAHGSRVDLDPASTASTGVEIALRAKEVEVRAYAAQHLSGGTWRGSRTSSPLARGSYQAGDRAALQVNLRSRKAVENTQGALEA